LRIGFIGAGAMAEALVKGLLRSSNYSACDICVSDISELRLKHFLETYNVAGHKDNYRVAESCDIIILAVKPDKVKSVISEVKDRLGQDKLLITIAAGVSTAAVEDWAGKNIPVIRVMPNTPCLVGKGISAITAGRYCDCRHLETAKGIFNYVGETVDVPEVLMNAVTGVSGSGPAYIYLVMEAMIDAAVTIGVSRDVATSLVVNTVLGSAEMVAQTGMHPAVLKAQVVSPGGTTAAGLNELEDGKIRALFTRAVRAAAERAGELGY